MTREEYIDLFHRANVNLVAFKPVYQCDAELQRMVEIALEDALEKLLNNPSLVRQLSDAITLSSKPAGFKQRETK